MIVRPFAVLVALSVALALAGCNKTPGRSDGTPGLAAPEPTVIPSGKVPTVGPNAPANAIGIATSPDPAACGADKLGPYLNLLPTSTAKGEIADKVGHHRVRYVDVANLGIGKVVPDRLTAVLGADGRIKQFRCG